LHYLNQLETTNIFSTIQYFAPLEKFVLTLAETEEFALIERAKDNPIYFQSVYDKYAETIFHFIYRRTNDEDIAADLCSQTFLKAIENLKKFENRGIPIIAWLYRIASNEMNMYFRKSKKTPTFSLETIFAHRIAEEEPEQMTEYKLQKLAACMEKLAEEDVILLQLRFYEEKSFKEIAFIIDASEASTKMRLYRLLEKMKKSFG
jgi:RNA polymerase sigma-70 factor (ECF subfamily)